MIDFFDIHPVTEFSSSTSSDNTLSTAAAMGLGAAVASSLGIAGYLGYRTIKPWTLRDSSTQMPDIDPLTPVGRGMTPPYAGTHGETGDPSEFLSPTPTGRLRKNNRARFF